jgi:hypothetical protein
VNVVNQSVEVVENAGDIETSGGSGPGGGSPAGSIFLYGLQGVTNTGTFTGRGGSASSTGNGATGASLRVFSDSGPVHFSGTADVSGGNGVGPLAAGGSAAPWPTIDIISATGGVDFSGAFIANGGTGGGGLGGQGGSGGEVLIMSQTGELSQISSSAGISVKPGAGNQAGSTGEVEIDGQLVTSAWSH